MSVRVLGDDHGVGVVVEALADDPAGIPLLERDLIQTTIRALLKEAPVAMEVIVVDDDSPDQTWRVVESLEMVPGEGDVRLHLVLKMMGNSTRVAVRAAVATLHLAKSGGALRLRLLEPPTFAGKHGGKSGGVLGMIR